jgi:Fur family ferric uptake transcriptional regulator
MLRESFGLTPAFSMCEQRFGLLSASKFLLSTTPLWLHAEMATKQSTAEITRAIRATGVKVTPGRVRVLELLTSAGRPLSHANIDSALSDMPMNRVTLYRVLDSLVANSLVLKAVDTQGVFHYSGAATQAQHSSHIHFHCTICGGMYCLDAKPPSPPKLPAGFVLGEIAFNLRGTCKSCASRMRNK